MKLPPEVQEVLLTLRKAGFEAYAVGGCVRDVLLKRTPKDWDVATSARPEEVQKLFPKSFYANQFGTVTVFTSPAPSPHLRRGGNNTSPYEGEVGPPARPPGEVEVTTYRIDAEYSDRRHPDRVTFTPKLAEDLARRDFTINAIALDEATIIDPFNGQADLKKRLIRAVGKPEERFSEDALRLLRAVRFAAQLNFTIEPATLAAIKKQHTLIQAVSGERVRDEIKKIVLSDQPERGFKLLVETELLTEILPEIAEGIGIEQNKHHVYTVFEHNVKSLQFAADYDYAFHIRMSALLHDVGKPRTRRLDHKTGDYTFYAHDIVGARMADKLLKRLHFSNDEIQQITHLVRHHMFYYDIGKVTEAGLRRLLRRVGKENFDDLIKLRIAERKGSGVPKARPYRLRHLQFLAEKVSQQPLTVGQLAINGHTLIDELKLPPSPILGGILNALLAEVLEDPKKNTKDYLLKRAAELKDKDPKELKKLGEAAVNKEEQKREDEIKRKYHV